MIEIIDLQKTYTVNPILKGISTTINDGDIISVIGGSGCGKSTFIRCINMLEKPSGGKVLLNSEDITREGYDLSLISHKIGMVFQSFNLFNHLTILENIMLPQINTLKISRQEAYDKAISLLHQVNLSSKAFSYPSSLSGGQKQRAAIARTLAMDPEVILFDEPTSALDPTMVYEVKSVIRNLTKTGKTMIIVTHDMDLAKSLSTRVFYMDEGIIYEEGSPDEIFNHPRKEKTRQFIQGLRVLDFRFDSKDYDFISATTQINTYCQKNQIAYNRVFRLQSVFEELCVQILLSEMEDVHIDFQINYSQTKDELTATVKYGREPFNIQDTKNELSLSLVRAFAEITDYKQTDGEYSNEIKLKII